MKENNTDVPRKFAPEQTDAGGLYGPDQMINFLKDKEDIEICKFNRFQT